MVLGPSSFDKSSYYYTELLAHINPLLNPVVYVMCNQQYRSSVKNILNKCVHSCRPCFLKNYALGQ